MTRTVIAAVLAVALAGWVTEKVAGFLPSGESMDSALPYIKAAVPIALFLVAMRVLCKLGA